MHPMSHIAIEQKYFTMAILQVLGFLAFFIQKIEKCALCAAVHAVGWCPNSEVTMWWSGCEPLSQVEQLWRVQLRTPMSAWEPRVICTHPNAKPLCQAGLLGLLQEHLNPQLFPGCWSCFPVFLNWLFSSLVLWLSMVKTKDSAAQTPSVFWSINVTFFLGHGSWLITLQKNVPVWEVQAALPSAVQHSGKPHPTGQQLPSLLWNVLTKWRTANSEQVTSRVALASRSWQLVLPSRRFSDTSRPGAELVTVVCMANSHLPLRVCFPNIWRVCLTSKSLVGKLRHVGGRGDRMCCCVWLFPSLHRISWRLP